MKPNYIFVGPRKTGTTSIYEYLKQYDSIYFPDEVKETFYFDKFYDKGESWYLDLYKNSKKGQRVCEVSPSYFNNRVVRERILKDLTQPKIIITLRHPKDRFISDYLHHIRYGHIRDPFKNVQKENIEGIYSQCNYKEEVAEWLNTFGIENVLILYFEDFINEKDEYYKKICSFIDVEFDKEKNMEIKSNEGKGRGNPYLTKFATKMSFVLKSLKLNSLVKFFINIGLKKIIFQSKKMDKNEYITKDDLVTIEKELATDIDLYESRKL